LVSFATIIKKLVDGSYYVYTGEPLREESFNRALVEAVRKRIGEFKYRPPEEVKERVVGSLDWARREICSKIYEYSREFGGRDLKVDLTLYSCNHPATGRFYMVVEEAERVDTGEKYAEFFLTRDYSEALGVYGKTKEFAKKGIGLWSFWGW